MTLTRQEIFNKVWERSKNLVKATQTEDEDYCMYRAENGLKCFAGVLIPDSAYSPIMEGKQFHTVNSNFPGIGILEGDALFVRELQCIHDDIEPENWENELENFADFHKLQIPNS